MTRVSFAHSIGAFMAMAAVVGSCGAALAADLPGPGSAGAGKSGYGPPPGVFGPPPQPGLITNPFRGQYFREPGRFDSYGYPVYGPIVQAGPNALYVASGCPQLLQPTYDISGNFVGYAPVPGCR